MTSGPGRLRPRLPPEQHALWLQSESRSKSGSTPDADPATLEEAIAGGAQDVDHPRTRSPVPSRSRCTCGQWGRASTPCAAKLHVQQAERGGACPRVPALLGRVGPDVTCGDRPPRALGALRGDRPPQDWGTVEGACTRIRDGRPHGGNGLAVISDLGLDGSWSVGAAWAGRSRRAARHAPGTRLLRGLPCCVAPAPAGPRSITEGRPRGDAGGLRAGVGPSSRPWMASCAMRRLDDALREQVIKDGLAGAPAAKERRPGTRWARTCPTDSTASRSPVTRPHRRARPRRAGGADAQASVAAHIPGATLEVVPGDGRPRCR